MPSVLHLSCFQPLSIQTREECISLAVQAFLFYGCDHPKKLAHLARFTYHTEDFNHLDLVAELEASEIPAYFN